MYYTPRHATTSSFAHWTRTSWRRSRSSRAWLGHGTLPVYAFHKPVGLTVSHGEKATHGDGGRKLVLNDYAERAHALHPDAPIPTAVGRLDKHTSGLLLFTADGPLNELLLRPGLLPKVYEATVRLQAPAEIEEAQLELLRRGCMLNDGLTRAEEVEVIERWTIAPPPPERLRYGLGASKKKRRQTDEDAVAGARTAAAAAAGAIPVSHAYRVRICVRVGRNRVVRRLLAAAGLPVFALTRVAFGPLQLARDFGEIATRPGELVALSDAQEAALRRACAEAERGAAGAGEE